MARRCAVVLLITIAFLLVSQPVQAYYVPAELQAEGQAAYKSGGNPGLYSFAMKYYNGETQGWQYSMLRGLAMEETNNGRITSLHIVMKQKYGK